MVDATAAPPVLEPKPRTLRCFMLPMEEIERIREAGGPLAECDLTHMARAIVAAVEVDGKVVAYWPVWKAVHAEPLWVHPDARNNPAVIRGILDQVELAMDEMGDPVIFAIIEDAEMLTSGAYAKRLGYQQVPGSLFMLFRQPKEEGT